MSTIVMHFAWIGIFLPESSGSGLASRDSHNRRTGGVRKPAACAPVFMGQLNSNFMRHHSKFRAGHEHLEDRY